MEATKIDEKKFLFSWNYLSKWLVQGPSKNLENSLGQTNIQDWGSSFVSHFERWTTFRKGTSPNWIWNSSLIDLAQYHLPGDNFHSRVMIRNMSQCQDQTGNFQFNVSCIHMEHRDWNAWISNDRFVNDSESNEHFVGILKKLRYLNLYISYNCTDFTFNTNTELAIPRLTMIIFISHLHDYPAETSIIVVIR